MPFFSNAINNMKMEHVNLTALVIVLIFLGIIGIGFIIRYVFYKRFVSRSFKKGDQLVVMSSDPKTVHKVRVKGNVIELK